MENRILNEIYNNKELNESYKNFSFTPMMLEWKKMKEELNKKYGKNTILFFQVGSFYETYFHDAYITSRVLWFTLTKKDKKKENSVSMAGMPLVADMSKLSKLLNLNFNIVFASEYPAPNNPQKIIRKINKIITPSSNLEFLDKNNNYLLSVYEWYNEIWFSLLDISTGDFKFLNLNKNNLEDIDILYKYNISEVILKNEPSDILKWLLEKLWIVYYNIKNDDLNFTGILEFQFGSLIEDLEIYHYDESIIAAANALDYIKSITNSDLLYINNIINISEEKRLYLDKSTITNLELIENYSGKRKTSLLWIINNTITAFWSRQLRQNILSPFNNKEKIQNRLNSIEYLLKDELYIKFRNLLTNFHDIEKLSAKLWNNSINPLDIINLSNSLDFIKEFKNLKIEENNLRRQINSLNNYDNLVFLVENALLENPSLNIREWNIFKDWYNKELDEERKIYFDIESVLKEKEIELKKETWLKTLRIIQNKNGFFIEIKHIEENLIPNSFIYLKKLNNTIRYTNNEIQELDKKYKLSELKIKEIEYRLFQQLRIDLSKYINLIFEDAKILSELDILSTFAYNAIIYHYNKPIINDKDRRLKIINWRHPIIEYINNSFIPNDTIITNKTLKLITGPNMGWKSTYLKQQALIYILFQIWSYIPADINSELPLIKWIYTRIGASDNLEEWISTFAKEIIEMKHIINKLDNNVLILIDEIWRWTDIENWLALAEAFLEYFLEKNKWYIFFSTHYSNLVNLENKYSNMECLKAKVEIINNEIQFFHKIIPWIERNSFWIEIAELYKLPKEIINKAKNIRNNIKY